MTDDKNAIGMDWPVTMRMIAFPDGTTEWEFDLPTMGLSAAAAEKLGEAFIAALQERVMR